MSMCNFAHNDRLIKHFSHFLLTREGRRVTVFRMPCSHSDVLCREVDEEPFQMWNIVRYFSKSIAEVLNCYSERREASLHVENVLCLLLNGAALVKQLRFTVKSIFEFLSVVVRVLCESVNSFVQQWARMESNMICHLVCIWSED